MSLHGTIGRNPNTGKVEVFLAKPIGRDVDRGEEIQDLYYRAIRQRQAVADARRWLLDCFAHQPGVTRAIRLYGSLSIVERIERHYDGGWIAFLRDGDNLKP